MNYNKFIEPWNKNAEARYDQIISGKDISLSNILIPEILDLINSLGDTRTFDVLDVGCGVGVLTVVVSKKVRSVLGIDPSIASIEKANQFKMRHEATNTNFEPVSIEKYAEEPNTFDLVIAHMTLHTIEKLLPALISIRKCMKQNGKFLFSIPHPCFYLEDKDIVSKTDFQYSVSNFYEIEFTISKDRRPLESLTPFFHRPLEVYSTSLFKAGFVIEKILEPMPQKAKTRKKYSIPREKPHFFVALCSTVVRD